MDKQKLESILGQLIDVKKGILGELVLRDNEWTDLVRECVVDKISRIENFERIDGLETTETKVREEIENNEEVLNLEPTGLD